MDRQKTRIMDVLRAGGSLTDNEARDNLGIERLGARICELRQAGVPIGDKWEKGHNRYGDETRWKRYFLVTIGGTPVNELQDHNPGQAAELE